MRHNSKLMKILRLVALCALMVSLSSCATIFTATKYPVAFNTTPEGAGITIENREGKVIFEGVTPTTVKLKSSAGYMKKEEYKITFTKDGYTQKVVNISAELDGWYIGNILLGALLECSSLTQHQVLCIKLPKRTESSMKRYNLQTSRLYRYTT